MNVEMHGISIQEILTFSVKDPAARKRTLAFLGFFFSGFILPILPGLFTTGYIVRLLRQVIHERKIAMPAWDDWNTMLMDGLKGMLVGIVYLAPAWASYFFGMMAYSLTAILIFSQLENMGPEGAVLAVLPGLILLTTMGLGILLMFLGGIPLPVALARLADTSDWKAAFQLRNIWKSLAANPAGYFAAWVVVLGLIYLVAAVYMFFYMTIVCCWLGMLLLILGQIWSILIFITMIGLAYSETKPRLDR